MTATNSKGGLKACTLCPSVLPATEEHFPRYGGTKPGLHDRLRPHCRACAAAMKAEWIDKHRERQRALVNANHDRYRRLGVINTSLTALVYG